ncbi:MAG: hypothetical protein GY899_08010 [Verrucomicrobiaceae bacterium]|nr:hypothetical protein [Verrucomicrobiaceae bacterium]
MLSARNGEGKPLYSIPDGTLGTMLNYYDEFAKRHTGDLELQASVATALNNGGELSLLLGDYPVAVEKLDRALALLENVETGGDDQGNTLTRKARIHHNLSEARSAQGMPSAAIHEALQSNKIHRTLAEGNPDSLATNRLLAASSLQLAQKLQAIGKSEEAIPLALETANLIGKLESENTVNEPDLSLLASATFEIGRIQRSLGELENAIKFQIEAIDRYLDLASSRPEATDYRFQLARAYGEAADLAALLAETAEASEANSEASAILRELAGSNPEIPDYRHELARRLRMNVRFLKASNSIQTALKELQDTIILLEDLAMKHPHIPVYRYDLATITGEQSDLLGELQKHDEATKSCRQAVDLMQTLLTVDLDVETNKAKRPKYRRALAGLYAKLGYHAQNAGDINEARHCIEKSQRHYQGLLEINSKDSYAIEGNKWAKESLELLPDPDSAAPESQDSVKQD